MRRLPTKKYRVTLLSARRLNFARFNIVYKYSVPPTRIPISLPDKSRIREETGFRRIQRPRKLSEERNRNVRSYLGVLLQDRIPLPFRHPVHQIHWWQQVILLRFRDAVHQIEPVYKRILSSFRVFTRRIYIYFYYSKKEKHIFLNTR